MRASCTATRSPSSFTPSARCWSPPSSAWSAISSSGASLSVVLNIAEGGGRRSRRDKARFYAIARGSATEVAALLDVLDRRRLGSLAAIASARRLAVRTVQMLTRIHQRLSA